MAEHAEESEQSPEGNQAAIVERMVAALSLGESSILIPDHEHEEIAQTCLAQVRGMSAGDERTVVYNPNPLVHYASCQPSEEGARTERDFAMCAAVDIAHQYQAALEQNEVPIVRQIPKEIPVVAPDQVADRIRAFIPRLKGSAEKLSLSDLRLTMLDGWSTAMATKFLSANLNTLPNYGPDGLEFIIQRLQDESVIVLVVKPIMGDKNAKPRQAAGQTPVNPKKEHIALALMVAFVECYESYMAQAFRDEQADIRNIIEACMVALSVKEVEGKNLEGLVTRMQAQQEEQRALMIILTQLLTTLVRAVKGIPENQREAFSGHMGNQAQLREHIRKLLQGLLQHEQTALTFSGQDPDDAKWKIEAGLSIVPSEDHAKKGAVKGWISTHDTPNVDMNISRLFELPQFFEVALLVACHFQLATALALLNQSVEQVESGELEQKTVPGALLHREIFSAVETACRRGVDECSRIPGGTRRIYTLPNHYRLIIQKNVEGPGGSGGVLTHFEVICFPGRDSLEDHRDLAWTKTLEGRITAADVPSLQREITEVVFLQLEAFPRALLARDTQIRIQSGRAIQRPLLPNQAFADQLEDAADPPTIVELLQTVMMQYPALHDDAHFIALLEACRSGEETQVNKLLLDGYFYHSTELTKRLQAAPHLQGIFGEEIREAARFLRDSRELMRSVLLAVVSQLDHAVRVTSSSFEETLPEETFLTARFSLKEETCSVRVTGKLTGTSEELPPLHHMKAAGTDQFVELLIDYICATITRMTFLKAVAGKV